MLQQLLKLGLLIPTIALCASLLLFLQNPLPLQVLRNATFDQYQRWRPRQDSATLVRVVDIDEESLRRFGQWPWPRSRVAELVTRLQQADAAAIAFDIVFAEPDRTSPSAMIALWQPPLPVREQLEQLPDHDRQLAAAAGKGRVILGFAIESVGRQVLPEAKARFITLGAPAEKFLHGVVGAVPPLPLLQQAAAGLGAITFIPDSDGVVRKVPLLVRIGDTLRPSLFAEALRVAQRAQNYTVRTDADAGLIEVRIGKLAVPTTAQGEIWVHYRRSFADRTIPAWRILAGEIPPAELHGKILLVGTSAQGLMDQRFSPLGGVIPGVEVHAQAIEQALTGQPLSRPAWANAAEACTIVLGGSLLGAIALGTRAAVSSVIFVVLLASLWSAGWLAFTRGGLLLDPVAPSLALLLIFVPTSIVRHLGAERRQRWIRRAFSRYVSPNLVNYLVAHPETLELGGKRQQCSFVFTDIAGFTSLMEDLDPAHAVSLLNAYLDRMIAIAFAHGGTLERIIGDAVVIMFSAPVPQPDHQRRALACALDMQHFAAQYAKEQQARGVAFGNTRIGIHSGEVLVGNFGGGTMFDYRALGDPINTASRLESVNKQLGTLMCASAATLAGWPELPARPVGRLLLKGKTHPLMVFEPLDADAAQDREYRRAFELLRARDSGSLEAFELLAATRPHDPLVALHLARLQNGESGDLIVLTEK